MLSSVKVVLRANDNTTSFSANDVGSGSSSLVNAFREVGNTGSTSDTTVQAGDTFFIQAANGDNQTWMKFGSMLLTNNTKITWLVVDKETSKSISTGSFYLG